MMFPYLTNTKGYWWGYQEGIGIGIRDGIGRGYKKPPIKKSMCGMGDQTEIPLRIPQEVHRGN